MGFRRHPGRKILKSTWKFWVERETHLASINFGLSASTNEWIVQLESLTESCLLQSFMAALNRNHRQRNLLHDHRVFPLLSKHVFTPSRCVAVLTIWEVILGGQAHDVDMLIKLHRLTQYQQCLRKFYLRDKFCGKNFRSTYDIIRECFNMEIWMNNDRLHTSLLEWQSLLCRLSVPFPCSNSQSSLRQVEDTMSSSKNHRWVNQRATAKTLDGP